jgi:RHS repeat-associated protein
VATFTTAQASGYHLSPGNSTTAGTDRYAYDPGSRLTSDAQAGAGAANSSNGYNDNGEIATQTGGLDPGTYHYSTTGIDAGQLTSISGSTSATFAYDNNGNRTCAAGSSCSSPNTTYTYDFNNDLTSWAILLNTVDYSYDGSGLLQKETEYQRCCSPPPQPSRWGFNRGGKPMAVPLGQLPLSRKGKSPVKHGRRHARRGSLPTLTVNLTWNAALGQPALATLNYNDGAYTNFIYGPTGAPLEQIWYNTSGVVQPAEYYYQDLSGNTRELIDQSATVQATYNYPPYGVSEAYAGTGNDTPLQYQGTYTDSFSGLVYDQSRWYDPSTGQFVSQDPIVNQTLQPYAYAGDNPANSGDPSGLCNSPPRAIVKEGQTKWDWYEHNHHSLAKRLRTFTSIAALRNWAHPYRLGKSQLTNNRTGPVERTLFQVTGYVRCQGSGFCLPQGNSRDGDLEFDFTDSGTGNQPRSGPFVHCEMPHPGCYEHSPWKSELDHARREMRNMLVAKLKRYGTPSRIPPFCVTVRGLGFWDTIDHPEYQDPELHPVLHIALAKGCQPTAQTLN